MFIHVFEICNILQDGSNQHQETAGSPAAPSDLAGDQAAAKGDQDVLSRDEPSLNIPFGDDAAEEGWEGLHDQDVPAAEHEDRAAHLEDQVAEPEPERRSFESQEEPSEREAHLEAQVEALSSELASKDTQLASLTHQLGELPKHAIPVAYYLVHLSLFHSFNHSFVRSCIHPVSMGLPLGSGTSSPQ